MLLSSSKYTMQYDLKITFIQRTLFRQKEPYSADGTLETSVRVRLSTSVNVSSNNSLRAATFALIMFEYVRFCFIRFYLLMPLPKMIAHYDLQGDKKTIHICCRTLAADCTLGSLQKQNIRLISSFHWRWNCFFPIRLDQQQFTLITATVCNQATEAGQPITARDGWEQTWVVHKSRTGASSPKCSPKWTYRNLMKMDLQSLKA